MHTDTPYEKRVCGAKKRDGTPCQKPPTKGMKRCRLHGGTLDKLGSANPNYKHGKYSNLLRGDLAKAYERALNDPDLLSLQHELALLDAQLEQLVKDGVEWREINGVIEQRRKIAETERRRLLEAEQMISIDRIRVLADAVMYVIQEHVTDARLLGTIQRDIRNLMVSQDR